MTDEKDQILLDIRSARDQIKTRADLIDFVDLLAAGTEKKVFDEHDIVDYLDGISLVLDGLGDAAPERPDWQLFGRVLLSAFFR